MAIEDTDSLALEAGESDTQESDGEPATVGEYTWADFMTEHGYGAAVDALYGDDRQDPPTGTDWDRVSFDPAAYLGFHPDDLPDRLEEAEGRALGYQEYFLDFLDLSTTPVTKGRYLWEHFKQEYYYDAAGRKPLDKNGVVEEFSSTEWLGFDGDHIEGVLAHGGAIAEHLDSIVSDRTVDVNPDIDEDAFFTMIDGRPTITNRYDLEKSVPMDKKLHFQELNRYWVNKPYAFVTIFHSRKENETKYYLTEPHLNPIEQDLQEFLTNKLRDAIKYSDDDVVVRGTEDDRRAVIERETRRLLKRYDLQIEESPGIREMAGSLFSWNESATSGTPDEESTSLSGRVRRLFSRKSDPQPEVAEPPAESSIESIDASAFSARPEPVLLDENRETVTEPQIVKLLYYLKRNFIGYERIDGIKHDINVEDISCDGYNSPVFVYHTDHEQIISNIYHGERRLDDFVVKLAQRSGKGISKRRPQVDATLPDGSRSQLTLGREVSDHGTNYTIRQFKDVPFTPIDMINWKTFNLEEMAFLWLCIENNKSLIFAGGTASGKTTSLNAVSLFIPSNSKIVSIEDTREVELPQRNWIASITRPSFTDDDKGNVDEFDLLEAALRQRPDYIVMGEIRGEEGRTLFQVMSTGHTTYTTFHADSVGEVLKRFTTDPINVSKTMFTALDLVSIQTSTRVQGNKVRRNKVLTEINHYDPENDEINVKDIYQWQAETDEFLKMGESNTLEEIKFDRGWDHETLEDEIFQRKVVLAYLIVNGLNEYRQVAATLQAFINDPETIMTLISLDKLEASLEDLRTMESVLIDVDPEKEALVPRPDPDPDTYQLAQSILDRAESELFDRYRSGDGEPASVSSVLATIEPADGVTATPGSNTELDAEPIEEPDIAGELPEGSTPAEPPQSDTDGAATADSGGGDDSTDTGDYDAPPEPEPDEWNPFDEPTDESTMVGETNGGDSSGESPADLGAFDPPETEEVPFQSPTEDELEQFGEFESVLVDDIEFPDDLEIPESELEHADERTELGDDGEAGESDGSEE